MSDQVKAVATYEFKASPDVVFEAWTNPEKARVWMKAALQRMGLEGDIRSMEIDARPGGTYLFSDMRSGQEARHWGTYEECIPGEKIVHDWNVNMTGEDETPTKVSIDFENTDDGCLVTLTHDLTPEYAEYIDQCRDAWVLYMEEAGKLI